MRLLLSVINFVSSRNVKCIGQLLMRPITLWSTLPKFMLHLAASGPRYNVHVRATGQGMNAAAAAAAAVVSDCVLTRKLFICSSEPRCWRLQQLESLSDSHRVYRRPKYSHHQHSGDVRSSAEVRVSSSSSVQINSDNDVTDISKRQRLQCDIVVGCWQLWEIRYRDSDDRHSRHQ